jgi:hypothetical protein
LIRTSEILRDASRRWGATRGIIAAMPVRPISLRSKDDDSALRKRWPAAASSLDTLVRATAAFLRGHVKNTEPARVFKQMFGDDHEGEMVLRAATAPATMANVNWAGPLAHATVSQTVVEMATVSAAASLVAAGMKLAFDHYATVHAPGRLVDSSDAGNWVSEGGAASLRVQRITAGTTLSPCKLIVLNAASREQIEQSNIEEVSRALLTESMALALDSAVFGTQAAGASPAGILNGVAPLSAAGHIGSVQDTAAEDIAALTAALVAVGAGRAPALIMNPKQANALKFVASPKFDLPIWPSNAVAAGTLIMVEPTSFASAFAPTPEFEISSQAVLQFQDTPTSDPMASAPTESLWQHDKIGWQTKLRAAFGMRAPHVAVINGVTW